MTQSQGDILTIQMTRSELAGLITCTQYALGRRAHPIQGEGLMRGTLRLPTEEEQDAMREHLTTLLVRLIHEYDNGQFIVDPSQVVTILG